MKNYIIEKLDSYSGGYITLRLIECDSDFQPVRTLTEEMWQLDASGNWYMEDYVIEEGLCGIENGIESLNLDDLQARINALYNGGLEFTGVPAEILAA